MTIKHHLTRPCSSCDSTRFALVERLQLEFIRPAERDYVYGRFDVVVCVGCRSTRFFLRSKEGKFMDPLDCDHEIIDVSSPNPYR